MHFSDSSFSKKFINPYPLLILFLVIIDVWWTLGYFSLNKLYNSKLSIFSLKLPTYTSILSEFEFANFNLKVELVFEICFPSNFTKASFASYLSKKVTKQKFDKPFFLLFFII